MPFRLYLKKKKSMKGLSRIIHFLEQSFAYSIPAAKTKTVSRIVGFNTAHTALPGTGFCVAGVPANDTGIITLAPHITNLLLFLPSRV